MKYKFSFCIFLSSILLSQERAKPSLSVGFAGGLITTNYSTTMKSGEKTAKYSYNESWFDGVGIIEYDFLPFLGFEFFGGVRKNLGGERTYTPTEGAATREKIEHYGRAFTFVLKYYLPMHPKMKNYHFFLSGGIEIFRFGLWVENIEKGWATNITPTAPFGFYYDIPMKGALENKIKFEIKLSPNLSFGSNPEIDASTTSFYLSMYTAMRYIF